MTMERVKVESKPVFTVIIPTKDRAEYLRHTLRTCTMQNYEPLEVIVADDGSTDNTREVVENASREDPRIRYITNEMGAGMRDNFEHALAQVKPGYVIALGGDDGLLPDGIQMMYETLNETGTELLAWPAPLYIYPKVYDENGQLIFYHQRGSKVIKSREFLARQADHLHYLSDVESPMFYVKGVASTKLIDKVRERSPDGRFYSCPTPDGYSGIVLAGEVERYAFSSRPFSLFGLSPTSQGLGYLSNKEEAKKSSENFFKDVSSRPMHEELASQPYSPLITLMTVDYLLTARDLPGWPGKCPEIDYRSVLLRSLGELAHGLYGEERVRRELSILFRIAEHHGLGEVFRDKVKKTRRYRGRRPFLGTGINKNVFLLNAQNYNVHNVFDAAYAVQSLYQTYIDLNPATIFKTIARSVSYRFHSLRRGGDFPPESEWAE